jgi:zinc protease
VIVCGALWWVATGAVAATEIFPWPVDHRVLDNGLRVTVVPMPSEGVVALGVWMDVGSRNEVDAGRTGFAHFFEHLMFHGTETMSAADRERELLRLGADSNAWTWLDETVYHLVLPSEGLDRALAMEADRFTALSLTEEGVRREAGAVYGEYRKGQANPDQLLYEKLQATAYGVHTYRHDTIGLEADIADMPTAFAYSSAFFDRWYRPEHAHVLVVGDADPEQAHAAVARAFAGWERGGATPRMPAVEPEQKGERRVEVPWTGEVAPRLSLAWKIPAHDATSTDTAALELAAEMLRAETGDLKRVLVRERRLAFDVGVWRDATVDPGLFRIDVELRNAADLPEAEQTVRSIVGALATSLDAAALEAVRTARTYGTLTSLTDPLTVLELVGSASRRGGDPSALDRWLTSLGTVTPDQVASAVRSHLTDSHLTVATLLPPTSG